MKLKGGYNVMMDGRPSSEILTMPDCDVLHLPLSTARVTFSDIVVEEGAAVTAGQILALAPDSHSLPLLAPHAGRVSVETAPGQIVLEVGNAGHAADARELPSGLGGSGDDGERRQTLLKLGAWSFLRDAATGGVPDPSKIPSAIIVSTLNLDPFAARGDAILSGNLPAFVQGLEALRAAANGATVHLVLPALQSNLVNELRKAVSGLEGVELQTVPLRYPYDNFALLCRHLELAGNAGNVVWGIRVEGVMAVNDAAGSATSCTSRIVAVGGPGAKTPKHVKVPTGYPIKALLETFEVDPPDVRVISGGALTGEEVGDPLPGVDAECTGLTLIPIPRDRTFFEFARLGFGEHSFARAFLSALRPPFRERFTADMRGEKRPCIACNFCDDVCPAGLLPFQLHRYVSHDALEEAETAGLDQCVGCGLCSYVCPSKIELREALLDGQVRLEREIRAHRDSKETE